MTMMDWDSDPELRAMREEFIASFRERREALAALLAAPDRDGGFAAEVRVIAHKLAGAAESYGFGELTRVGAAIDDYAALAPGGADPARMERYARLLDEMLASALADGEDPGGFRADPRYGELISAAGSLVSAARS